MIHHSLCGACLLATFARMLTRLSCHWQAAKPCGRRLRYTVEQSDLAQPGRQGVCPANCPTGCPVSIRTVFHCSTPALHCCDAILQVGPFALLDFFVCDRR